VPVFVVTHRRAGRLVARRRAVHCRHRPRRQRGCARGTGRRRWPSRHSLRLTWSSSAPMRAHGRDRHQPGRARRREHLTRGSLVTAASKSDRSLLLDWGRVVHRGCGAANLVIAKTTRVVLVCDLHGDGTEAATTIRMDNGAARELDLCQSHFDELTGAGRRLRPHRRTAGARSATKAATKRAAAKTRRRGRGAPDSAAVRAWARAYGHPVSDRGRIPRHILQAFATPE
jgi:Lsr2